MIKVVLFDLDGVVIKDAPYIQERCVTELRIRLSVDAVNAFFKTDFKACVEGKADLKELLRQRVKEWGWPYSVDKLMTYWFEGNREFDSRFYSLLKQLREGDIRCFLVSNNEKYRTEYLTNELKLLSIFDGIFSSCVIGAQKNKPVFWESVHASLGFPAKSEVAVWDDGRENVEVARTFGYTSRFYSNFTELNDWVGEMT